MLNNSFYTTHQKSLHIRPTVSPIATVHPRIGYFAPHRSLVRPRVYSCREVEFHSNIEHQPSNPPSIQFHFHQIPSSYAFPLPFRQTTHDDRGLNSSIRPFPFTAAAALPPPPLQHKFNCEASVFRSSPRRPSAAQQQQRQMPRKETSPPPPYRIILRTIAYGRRSGASNLFLRNILLWRVFAFAFLFPDSAVS